MDLANNQAIEQMNVLQKIVRSVIDEINSIEKNNALEIYASLLVRTHSFIDDNYSNKFIENAWNDEEKLRRIPSTFSDYYRDYQREEFGFYKLLIEQDKFEIIRSMMQDVNSLSNSLGLLIHQRIKEIESEEQTH